jgi:D-3-phosphoglycerate dehydrogenase / 2-oxoglutarate reductase
VTEKFRVQFLNHMSANGLKRFPWDRFAVSPDGHDPHAILVRSADMHRTQVPATVLAIGRAGSGTNNIPVAEMSARGIPVFNAPGANANAVKELVLAGMLLAARNLDAALGFVDSLPGEDPDFETTVESAKKAFAGYELAGHTLGVVGLGKIGCLVADAAIKLGMHVIGYDPAITVESAWSLPSTVKKAEQLSELLKHSHFVTLHVPLMDATQDMIDAGGIAQMKHSAVLLNFSRNGVVDEAAVLEGLASKQLAKYVCDFPSPDLTRQPGVILLPHLGASTREAEENCAVMVADQVRDYLLDGTIRNSVNFPDVTMPRESAFRVAIANANVPNMVGGISHEMAEAGLNIATMTNKSRKDVAYTLVDVDSDVPDSVIKAIAALDGVLMVRYLPQGE